MSRSLALASFVFASIALSGSVAHADRSTYAGLGAGFYNDFDCCALHGRIQGEIGWHFGGDMTGFFLELDAIGTFGPNYGMFTGGVRLGGDIDVHRDRHFRLLLRPSGLIGLGVRDYFNDGYGPYGNFTLQPAFDVRFVFADGLIALWVRPVAFDLMFWFDHGPMDHNFYFSAAYQALAGIDFQF